MSIIKFRPAADRFVRIPNDTADDPRLTADALAVIVYLAAKPVTWKPRDTDVRRRFRWGRDKMRSVWNVLERAGYAERLHRQPLGGGQIGTVTTLAAEPVFRTGGGLTGGGSAATGGAADGSAADGQPTTIKRKREKEESSNKQAFNKQPVAFGDGKNPDAPASPERLSFASEFGFAWSPSHAQLLDENRACAILIREGIKGADIARRVVAEWAASMMRRPDGDPAAALIWVARAAVGTDKQGRGLAHTSAGDERLPVWG